MKRRENAAAEMIIGSRPGSVLLFKGVDIEVILVVDIALVLSVGGEGVTPKNLISARCTQLDSVEVLKSRTNSVTLLLQSLQVMFTVTRESQEVSVGVIMAMKS